MSALSKLTLLLVRKRMTDRNEAASVAQRDIAGVHVDHEHAKAFEDTEDRLNLDPALTELLLFLCAPIG